MFEINVSSIIDSNVFGVKIGENFSRTPKLLNKLNCKSKGENNKKIRSRGTLPVLQHFKGRGACWSSGMGTRTNDKRVINSHGPIETKQQVD
jgi:hypothetical protein